MTTIEQSFIVMLLGMSIVFFLLISLVFAMRLMSRIVVRINALWPEPHTVEAQGAVKTPSAAKMSSDALDEDEALAIVIALAMHQRKLAENRVS